MQHRTGPGNGARFVLTALCSLLLACSGPEAPALPDLPTVALEGFLPSVQQQVAAAREAVERNPESSAEIGRLGMIYQSYSLHRAAAACYARAYLLDPAEFRWAYLLGYTSAEAGETETAIDAFNAALETKPGSSLARLKLAGLLLRKGELEASEALYRSIPENEPYWWQAAFGIGQIQLRRGETSAAIRNLEAALELTPTNATVHYALGQALQQQGELKSAQQHLAAYEKFKGLETGMSDPLLLEISRLNISDRPHIASGRQYAEAGQVELAIAEYERALAVNPQSGFAHTPLLRLYGAMGDMDKAESHYRSAVALNPGDAQAPYFLGMLWLQRQEYENAANMLGNAAAIKPRDAVIRTQLGHALERMGNFEAALEQYLAALGNEPGNRDANYLAARMLLANHQPAEALARLELAWQIEDQQSPRYLALGAAVYAWLGEGESANRKLEQSIALRNEVASGQQVSEEQQGYARHALGLVLAADKSSVGFPLQLGVMLEHLGNTDDARIHYREAVNRDIDHREANFMLGRSLVAIGRHREAITCLNRNIDPDNRLTPAILGILATAFEESGESGKAFETLEYASWLAGSHGDLSLAKTLERRARKIEYIMQNTPQE